MNKERSIVEVIAHREDSYLIRAMVVMNQRKFQIHSVKVNSTDTSKIQQLKFDLSGPADRYDSLIRQLGKLVNTMEVKQLPKVQKDSWIEETMSGETTKKVNISASAMASSMV